MNWIASFNVKKTLSTKSFSKRKDFISFEIRYGTKILSEIGSALIPNLRKKVRSFSKNVNKFRSNFYKMSDGKCLVLMIVVSRKDKRKQKTWFDVTIFFSCYTLLTDFPNLNYSTSDRIAKKKLLEDSPFRTTLLKCISEIE